MIACSRSAEEASGDPPPLPDSSGDAVSDLYNRDVETFNRGIALANQRNYSGALGLLESLYAKTAFSDIKDRLGPLLADLRKRAGRK